MNHLYFCDGKACNRNCAENGYAECHHTSNEKHARNKIRRKRMFVKDGDFMVENEKHWPDPNMWRNILRRNHE